jgi:hypothetical protein
MVEKDEVVVLQSVGGVDEDIREPNENLTINLLDIENVHLQCDNDLVENDELHFIPINIVAQVHKWNLNNLRIQFVGVFFAINNNFPIDIKNP